MTTTTINFIKLDQVSAKSAAHGHILSIYHACVRVKLMTLKTGMFLAYLSKLDISAQINSRGICLTSNNTIQSRDRVSLPLIDTQYIVLLR